MANDKVKGITIEIGGDTTGLDNALQDINTRSNEATKELKQVEKALKLDPSNTELVAQKQKLLKEEAKLAAEKVDALHKAQKEFNKLVNSGEIEKGSKEYNAFQREVATAEANLKKAKEAVKEFGKEHNAIAKVKAAVSSVREGIEKLKSSVAGKIVSGAFEGVKKAASGAFEVMKAGVTAVGAVGAAIGAAAGKIASMAEETEEYRTNQAKLETTFEKAGFSAGQTADTYKNLYAVLGDDGKVTESMAHIAQMATSQKDLADWTTIATGVYATFGDSLPIESLTEAANETAKTGQLTGALADALNWAGVSEEAFQEQLAQCATEQERSALITETLNGLYAETADAYRENNEALLKSNEAAATMQDALAEIGEAVQPMVAEFKAGSADLTKAFADMVKDAAYHGEVSDVFVTQMSGAIEDMVGTIENEVPAFVDATANIIEAILEAVEQAMPTILNAVETVVPNIIDRILSLLPKMAETGIKLLTALVTQLPKIIKQILEALPEIIDSIIDALLDSIPLLIEAGVELFTAIVANMDDIIIAIVRRMPELLEAIVDSVLDNVPEMISAGEDLIKGLWEGIKDMGKWLGDKVSGFFGDMVDGIKDLFGIHSPSTLMEDEVGRYLAEGVGEGFAETMKRVSREMQAAIPKKFNTEVDAAHMANQSDAVRSAGQKILQAATPTQPVVNNYYQVDVHIKEIKELGDIARLAESRRVDLRLKPAEVK